METPKIQTLMLYKLVCSMQAIEGTHIIENLFNSLSHKVGVLKRDGVKAWQMVCNMAIAKNIKNKKTTTKNLVVDRQFLYKAMKKKGRLLSLNMPLWGTAEWLQRSNSLAVSVRELVQG